MAKVRDVMSSNVPHVDCSDTVLEACRVMNSEKSSGVVVSQGGKVRGMFTDRALLRNFVPLNKRPDEVKVSDVLVPLLRIDPEASTKQATKKIVENGFTRLGVFDGEKFLGWVTLSDLARETSKKNLLGALLSSNEPEVREILCPNCRKAFLEKIVNTQGEAVRWQCRNCNYAL